MLDESAGDLVDVAALVDDGLRRIARVICEEAARMAPHAPLTADVLMRVCDALRAESPAP